MAQAVLPDSQVFVLEGYTMPNTPMSDLDPKVKELLEAARHVVDTGERNGLYRLGDAIAAFNPPKPVPVIPAWEEFVSSYRGFGKDKAGDSSVIATDLDTGVANWIRISSGHEITRPIYEAIRQATSKAPTE